MASSDSPALSCRKNSSAFACCMKIVLAGVYKFAITGMALTGRYPWTIAELSLPSAHHQVTHSSLPGLCKGRPATISAISMFYSVALPF